MEAERYCLKITPDSLKEQLQAVQTAGGDGTEYLNSVSRADLCVDLKNNSWEFRLTGPKIPPPDNFVSQLKQYFLNSVEGLNNLTLLTQSAAEDSLEVWFSLNWESLKMEILQLSPVLRTVLEYARPVVGSNSVVIQLASPNAIEICRRRQLDTVIAGWVKERRGQLPRVEFKLGDFKGKIEQDAQKIQQEAEVEKEKRLRRQQLRAKKQRSVVLEGRKIKSSGEPIEEIRTQLGEIVTVEGVVIAAEFVRTGGKKKNFVKGIISDRSDSVSFMIFMDEVNEQLLSLKNNWLKIRGRLKMDNYRRRKNEIIFVNDVNRITPRIRRDEAPVKRVELHCHSKMSRLDATSDIRDIVQRAAYWDHPAVAISDHGVVHSFPEAARAGEEFGVKIIYGMEGYLVNDKRCFVLNDLGFDSSQLSLAEEFIVLDCETTGFSPLTAEVFQVAALRIRNGQVVDSYNSPVAVHRISCSLLDQTPLTKQQLLDGPPPERVSEELDQFIGQLPVLIYEASFVQNFLKKMGYQFRSPVVHLRRLVEKIWAPGRANLNQVFINRFKEKIEHEFDACKDVQRTFQIFQEISPKLSPDLSLDSIKSLEKQGDHKASFYHVLLLVRNRKGLENLYKLVSRSHIDYFYRQPRILRSDLEELREGLLVGTACEQGEIFQRILRGESDGDLRSSMKFYDFIELQPVDNNKFMLCASEDKYAAVSCREDLKNFNRRLYELAVKSGKPVVGTSDAHFLDPEDARFRAVLQAGQKFVDANDQPPIYLRTTDEMIMEFDYLGEDRAIQIAVENPRLLASSCENVRPVPDEFCPPSVENAREIFENTIATRAHQLYGEKLPDLVAERLKKEQQAILGNHFESLYVISARLVEKSLGDDYLVGSRGSVGSSFAAYLMGITEVNPLPPHYRCEQCDYVEFPGDSGNIVGIDLEQKDCPDCGSSLEQDGFDIPFEVFCGFDGTKIPDIDLNFSGEYQQEIFHYLKNFFGEGNIFRAGTITTISDRTAAGFANKYIEEYSNTSSWAEKERLKSGIEGVKQNTSQHPGGMIVVPENRSIYQFTPINYPANDRDSSFLTTHFDYHSMEDQLVKLDILGHENPTQLRHLKQLTGIDPVTIPLDDPQTLQIFTDLSSLNLTEEELGMKVGVLGVPEFGTIFVRDLVTEAAPTSFADLVRISGLSHGENVWNNNARDLIKQGRADLTSVITCRDDIMNYLIKNGLPENIAFQIMEDVRKGKGLKPEYIQKMQACRVPAWYIKSCDKIKYLFPKAHAAAYVLMAFRIAYFKVHHPTAFYASYLSLKADHLSAAYICSLSAIEERMEQLQGIIEQKRREGKTEKRDEKEYGIMEVLREGYLRGISVRPPRVSKSGPFRFRVESEQLIRAPYVTIEGLGNTVAEGIEKAFKEKRFTSIEDLQNRTQVNSTVTETADGLGFFEALPPTENRQLF